MIRGSGNTSTDRADGRGEAGVETASDGKQVALCADRRGDDGVHRCHRRLRDLEAARGRSDLVRLLRHSVLRRGAGPDQGLAGLLPRPARRSRPGHRPHLASRHPAQHRPPAAEREDRGDGGRRLHDRHPRALLRGVREALHRRRRLHPDRGPPRRRPDQAEEEARREALSGNPRGRVVPRGDLDLGAGAALQGRHHGRPPERTLEPRQPRHGGRPAEEPADALRFVRQAGQLDPGHAGRAAGGGRASSSRPSRG